MPHEYIYLKNYKEKGITEIRIKLEIISEILKALHTKQMQIT